MNDNHQERKPAQEKPDQPGASRAEPSGFSSPAEDVLRMDPKQIETLLALMRTLRDPEHGCPWDVEQTFETIAPYTIEEAYEVSDAIARGDMEELKEELGDLLLQVVFHARMAEEAGYFAFPDVVEAIVRKMLFRHPHVFGAPEERGRVKADFWEQAKEKERARKSTRKTGMQAITEPAEAQAEDNAKEEGAPFLVDDVALALPALMRAQKLQKRAARAGYDWPDVSGVAEKVAEEARELASAHEKGAQKEVEEEIGDLLFTVVNLARHLNVDAETALRRANDKFAARMRAVERLARQEGRQLSELTDEARDRLWEQAKGEERES